MALSQGKTPNFDAMTLNPVTLLPNSTQGTGNSVPPGVNVVVCGANVNGVNDFIVLPSLGSVPLGHEITVLCNAAGMEIRTPSGSAEEINSEDCDGTKEYTVPAGSEVHKFVKIGETLGWMGYGFTAIGAKTTAVVPDA